MLPFRSGRASFSGVSAAFFLFTLLSCVALAADKGAKPKEKPTPQEGLTNVPIPAGHDVKGLVLPDFDPSGKMRGKLLAGVTRRLDDERVEFKGVHFTTYNIETEKTDMEIIMNTSVFNLKTQILNSTERTTVKRTDFEISGDTMEFEMISRKGKLAGNVKMVVHGKARKAENAGE